MASYFGNKIFTVYTLQNQNLFIALEKMHGDMTARDIYVIEQLSPMYYGRYNSILVLLLLLIPGNHGTADYLKYCS